MTVKTKVTVNMSPHFNSGKRWRVDVLILPHLTDYTPSPHICDLNLSFLKDLCLAGPALDSSGPVDMIIGAGIFPSIIEEGLRKNEDNNLAAQATAIGWIVTGASAQRSLAQPITNQQITIDQALSNLLKKFWQQEEVLASNADLRTPEETECERHFITTHRRTKEERYVLRLPLKPKLEELGNSSAVALSMLRRMEKRFSDAPQLYHDYLKFMDNYIELEHITEVANQTDLAHNDGFYLPHHGVLKSNEDTSKLRIVFNGSVRLQQGLAVNYCLHVGPKLQSDIFYILLRWRMFRYVFSADIEKLFRQILIEESDRKYQKIFWRATPEEPIHTYCINTVTYGLASSPYQAICTLHQLASDEYTRYLKAVDLLLKAVLHL